MNLSIRELNELIYSLGTTATKGMFCDKELNASLLDKLYNELNRKIAEEAIDEEIEFDDYKTFNEAPYGDDDDIFTDHLLGADLDYIASIEQDSQRYEDIKKRGEGTAQAILDYVDMKGAVSHKELHEYYKSLNGSNTFSWCLRNLQIPYKNRKTQRYLAKEGKAYSNAKYVVKVANPSNWVVKHY